MVKKDGREKGKGRERERGECEERKKEMREGN